MSLPSTVITIAGSSKVIFKPVGSFSRCLKFSSGSETQSGKSWLLLRRWLRLSYSWRVDPWWVQFKSEWSRSSVLSIKKANANIILHVNRHSTCIVSTSSIFWRPSSPLILIYRRAVWISGKIFCNLQDESMI